MIIIGAGMAGCMAALANNNSTIFEAGSEPESNHNAVLRFRDDSVSKLTGIEFKKVKVRKGVWADGRFHKPNIRLANLYSRKVIGKVLNRSIWNIDPVERYVAPRDFAHRLVDMVRDRINFNTAVDSIDAKKINVRYSKDEQAVTSIDRCSSPIISTAPMSALSKMIGEEDFFKGEKFKHRAIQAYRFEVENCDVHQTIYYPDPDFAPYRATLTGGDLIIECVGAIKDFDFNEVLASFGFDSTMKIKDLEKKEQRYGKISEIDDEKRRAFIFSCTINYNIYSLGRYGIWKNILLDDVAQDIEVIKKLTVSDRYAHHMKSGV